MIVPALRTFVSGRTVVVTGHSGFKGGWLTLWLASLGAKVVGISLPPDQGPDALFDRAGIDGVCRSAWIDIRDADGIVALFRETQPDIVFHLAAQALVRRAYSDPIATFATNALGTAHVLEAARLTDSVRALVCVTTDKVYDNREWPWPYRETDALGGQDPYSASKSAAEMIARSYMTALHRENGPLPLATARGGNVVGGGDWSADRLIPDVVRSLWRGEKLVLRNPSATRPWQHVLELCAGYLILAMQLERGRPARGLSAADFRGVWNFGPEPTNEIPVGGLVQKALQSVGEAAFPVEFQPSPAHESQHLRLDSSKAKATTGWRPLLSIDETIEWTTAWYRDYRAAPTTARQITEAQIARYERMLDDNLDV